MARLPACTAVPDGKLITGQNPASSKRVAEVSDQTRVDAGCQMTKRTLSDDGEDRLRCCSAVNARLNPCYSPCSPADTSPFPPSCSWSSRL